MTNRLAYVTSSRALDPSGCPVGRGGPALSVWCCCEARGVWSSAPSVCLSDPGAPVERDPDDVDERHRRSQGAAAAGSPEPARSKVAQLRDADGVISPHRLRRRTVERGGRRIGVLARCRAPGTSPATTLLTRSTPAAWLAASKRHRKPARIAVSVLLILVAVVRHSLLSFSVVFPSRDPHSVECEPISDRW